MSVNIPANMPVNISLNMDKNMLLCQEIEKPKRKYKSKTEEPKEKKGWKGIINDHNIIDGLRMCPYCDYKTKKCSTLSIF